MRKDSKKSKQSGVLSINREMIRTLTADESRAVVGGMRCNGDSCQGTTCQTVSVLCTVFTVPLYTQ